MSQNLKRVGVIRGAIAFGLAMLSLNYFGDTGTAYALDVDPDVVTFDKLIKDYEDVQTKVKRAGASVFLNSLEVTIFHAKDLREALTAVAFIIPTDQLVEVHPSVVEALAMPRKKDAVYWKMLANAMWGIGYIESGKSSGISLMAKSFPETIPENMYLVMGGTHQGFFTLFNGDKFVPGISYYERVLSQTIQSSNLLQVPLYWSDRLADANKLYAEGRRQDAQNAYRDFLRDPKAPAEKIAEAFFNLGVTFLETVRTGSRGGGGGGGGGGELDLAQASFTQAIELNSEFARAYLERSMIFAAKEQYDPALQNCNAALRYSKDPHEIQTAQKLKILIEGRIRNGQ